MKSLVKLTKVQLIREVNNDMCHNWYFICYGRIYTEDLTKFMRVKYIVWFDIYDICESYDKESVTKTEIKEYAKELAFSFIDAWHNYKQNFKDFVNDCNQTINRYNGD